MLTASWTPLRIDTVSREGLQIGDLDKNDRLDIIGNGFILFAPSDPRNEDWTEVYIDSEFINTKAAIYDFNGDSRLDVVLTAAEGNKQVYLAWYEGPENPLSSAWTKHIIEEPLTKNHQLELADVDLDGDIDILGGFSFGQNGVVWWENIDGSATAFRRNTIDAELGCYNCAAADFDKDGDTDFAGPSEYTGSIYLYQNLASDLLNGNPDIQLALGYHFKLDSLSNGELTDELQGLVGAAAGVSITPGKIGGALSFDGISGLVELGTFDPAFPNGFTMSFWVKPQSLPSGEARFLSKADLDVSGDHYIVIGTSNGSNLEFRLRGGGGEEATLISPDNLLSVSDWSMVTVTYDSRKMRIYHNAVEVAAMKKTGSIDQNASAVTALGNEPVGRPAKPYHGLLDELRIYNKALSIVEINALLNFDGQCSAL